MSLVSVLVAVLLVAAVVFIAVEAVFTFYDK